jgi:hypothetical protein
MAGATGRTPQAGRELDRIVFFSDAVFAIAITILVLDIGVPDGLSPAKLPARVLGLWPKVPGLCDLLSGAGRLLAGPPRVFRPIRGYNGTLIWLNF